MKHSWHRRIFLWFRCPPKDTDLFGTRVRAAIQIFFGTACQWEYRADSGEEEHGLNYGKRYCKACGKCQHGFIAPYNNNQVIWEDFPPSENNLP